MPDDVDLGEMPLADHAFYGLVWASTVLMERVGAALTRAHGLPLSWFEVLLWLSAQRAPMSATTLGSKTMLSRSQVSRVVDALAERGLVERTPSTQDARSVTVSLTPAGRTLFADADTTRRETLAPLFTDALDESDLDALHTIWQKLKAHRNN